MLPRAKLLGKLRERLRFRAHDRPQQERRQVHLCRDLLARSALWRWPLRAAWPCILDPRHRRGDLRWCLLAPTGLAIRLALAATVITVAVFAAAVVVAAMTIVPLGPAVAATACAGRRLIVACCRRLAHP